MFLIETERGCSRGCTYCVMRRSTNGGMRIVPKERILELVPDDARRVGLVGAAVSDHPKIVEIVRDARRARRARSASRSLRPDRLNDDFVGALEARRLPHADDRDGRRERAHPRVARAPRAQPKHLERAAELARDARHEPPQALPDGRRARPRPTRTSTSASRFVDASCRGIIPVALGIAPFCPSATRRSTAQPFAGIDS